MFTKCIKVGLEIQILSAQNDPGGGREGVGGGGGDSSLSQTVAIPDIRTIVT